MIRIADLQEAIAECQGEKNPNAQTYIKLAAYYTILNQLTEPQIPPTYSADPAPAIHLNSGSEFCDIVNGTDAERIMPIIDELVQTIAAVEPPLYEAFMRKVRETVK